MILLKEWKRLSGESKVPFQYDFLNIFNENKNFNGVYPYISQKH